MKVKLSTKLMKGLVSKLIAKSIYKKYGYKVSINIDELEYSSVDGEATVHANVEVKLDKKEFKKIIKSIGSKD